MPLRKGSNTPMNIKKGVTQIEKVTQGTNLIWKYRTETPSVLFVSKDESSITFDVTNNDERSVTVYYGTSSNTTENPTSFDQSETKRLTLSGLNGGTSYTVRTRAQGFQSLFSSEVTFTQTTDVLYVTNDLSLYVDASDSNSYPGSGNTWFDISGNNNDLTRQDNPIYQTGFGGYFDLNGSSDYFSSNFNPNLNNNRLYTYEIWIRSSNFNITSGDNTALISNYGGSATTAASHFATLSDGIRFWERNTSNVSNQMNTTVSVADGNWHHIVGVASSNDLQFYMDGVLENSTSGRPGGTITSGQNLVFGGNHLGRYQTIDIALIRVYLDKALTLQEIEQNFDADKTRFGL